MDGAVIGASAVVAGGVLGLSGQLLNERFRAKRERHAEERREARELRLAARLVMEELAEAMALIEKAAQTRRYWLPPRLMPTQTWTDYRTDLAAAITSPMDWRRITAAYDSINNLNWTVGHRRNTNQTVEGSQHGVFVEPEDNTRNAWLTLWNAIEVLEETLHVSGPASRLSRTRRGNEQGLWPHGDGAEFDIDAAKEAERQQLREAELRRIDGR